MIKNLGARKLSRTGSHRKALLRNLATALFQHETIETTVPKAKELASYSEHLITLARPNDVNAKRALSREIKNADVLKKIFDVLVPRYQTRAGGYTRILKTRNRRGDSAEMALIKLVV